MNLIMRWLVRMRHWIHGDSDGHENRINAIQRMRQNAKSLWQQQRDLSHDLEYLAIELSVLAEEGGASDNDSKFN